MPARQLRQQLPDVLFVADEIVIDDKNGPSPTERLKRVKFGEHLLIALGSRHAPINLDDVAKLARERTAPRVLDGHCAVTLKVRQVKVGHRRGGEWRPLGGLIRSLGLAPGEVCNELRQRRFSFAEKNVIGIRQVFNRRRNVRAAEDDAFAFRFASFHHLF